MEFPLRNREFEEAMNLEVVKLFSRNLALIPLVVSSGLGVIKKGGIELIINVS